MARALFALAILLTFSCAAVSGARQLNEGRKLQQGYDAITQSLYKFQGLAVTFSRDSNALTDLDAATFEAGMGGYQVVVNDLKALENALLTENANITGYTVFQTCDGPLADAYYNFQSDYSQGLNVLENHAGPFATLPELGAKVSTAVSGVRDALQTVVNDLAEACPNQAKAFEQKEQDTERSEQVVIVTYEGGALTNELANGNLGLPAIGSSSLGGIAP